MLPGQPRCLRASQPDRGPRIPPVRPGLARPRTPANVRPGALVRLPAPVGARHRVRVGLAAGGHGQQLTPQKTRTPPCQPCILGPRVISSRLRGAKPVPSRTYEITFVGQAGTVLPAEFDDCEISVGPSTTTLHLQLSDQGALHGLLQRVASFGLELIDVSVVPPANVRDERPRADSSIQVNRTNDDGRGIPG